MFYNHIGNTQGYFSSTDGNGEYLMCKVMDQWFICYWNGNTVPAGEQDVFNRAVVEKRYETVPWPRHWIFPKLPNIVMEKRFWQQVKSEFLAEKHHSLLCYASFLFRIQWTYYSSDMLGLVSIFKHAKKLKGVTAGISLLLIPWGTHTMRSARLRFIDYCINTLP